VKNPRGLEDFLPASLDGAERVREASPPTEVTHAAYLLERPRLRFVNVQITLLDSADKLAFARAQYKGLKPGQTQADGEVDRQGVEVGGYVAERRHDAEGSVVSVILADKVEVRVQVEAAVVPDEAVPYLRLIDLAGLERFVRK
jgi:hypothetical protein